MDNIYIALILSNSEYTRDEKIKKMVALIPGFGNLPKKIQKAVKQEMMELIDEYDAENPN